MQKRRRIYTVLLESDIEILQKQADELDIKLSQLIHNILHHHTKENKQIDIFKKHLKKD